MKKAVILFIQFALAYMVTAQIPDEMSYQAVIRNINGELVKSSSIRMRISILQGSETGTTVYIETQIPTTNANGLISIEIGDGTPTKGTFSEIDWSTGKYFIKTEVDPSGGTNYTITGTSQLLSVPYALYAKSTGTYTENDPVFVESPSNNITSANITNWNTAFGWGNHSGLYRPISYIPAWTEITGKPSFAKVATSGSYNDLTDKPNLFDGQYSSLTGKPIYATVATTGSYNDLINEPTLFDGQYSSLTGKPTFATVATSGDYNDLKNKPDFIDDQELDLDTYTDSTVLQISGGNSITLPIFNISSTKISNGGSANFYLEGGKLFRITIKSCYYSTAARIGEYLVYTLNQTSGWDPVVLKVAETSSIDWTFSYALSGAKTRMRITSNGWGDQGLLVVIEKLSSKFE